MESHCRDQLLCPVCEECAPGTCILHLDVCLHVLHPQEGGLESGPLKATLSGIPVLRAAGPWEAAGSVTASVPLDVELFEGLASK